MSGRRRLKNKKERLVANSHGFLRGSRFNALEPETIWRKITGIRAIPNNPNNHPMLIKRMNMAAKVDSQKRRDNPVFIMRSEKSIRFYRKSLNHNTLNLLIPL